MINLQPAPVAYAFEARAAYFSLEGDLARPAGSIHGGLGYLAASDH